MYVCIYMYMHIYIYDYYMTIILYIGSVYMVPLKRFGSFLKIQKSNIGGGVRPYIEGGVAVILVTSNQKGGKI